MIRKNIFWICFVSASIFCCNPAPPARAGESRRLTADAVRYIESFVEKQMDEMDNKILTTIIDKFKGGPVGISTIATAVGENVETIEEVYEPFLIQEGFIMRTPRGREANELAYKHLGRDKNGKQNELF